MGLIVSIKTSIQSPDDIIDLRALDAYLQALDSLDEDSP